MATVLQLLSQKHRSRLRAVGLRYAVLDITFVLIVFHSSIRLFAWGKKKKKRNTDKEDEAVALERKPGNKIKRT